MEKIIAQKIQNISKDSFSIAEKYFMILSAINSLRFTEREVQVLAFIAVYGNITEPSLRKKFYEEYSTTSATVNNIVARLKKVGILVKEDKRIVLDPAVNLKFECGLELNISLRHEQ